MTIQKFVNALEAAHAALEEVDEIEINALLERWYKHRYRYLTPYGQPGGSVPSAPAFQPFWHDLTLADSDASSLHFEKWQCGEQDYVYVPVAYLLDPDGWIAEDKKERVTKETWERQRQRALEAQREDRLEAQAEALRKAGFKVVKE